MLSLGMTSADSPTKLDGITALAESYTPGGRASHVLRYGHAQQEFASMI